MINPCETSQQAGNSAVI